MNKKLFFARFSFATVETILAAILLYGTIINTGRFFDGESIISLLFFIGSVASAVLAIQIYLVAFYEAAKEKGNKKLAKKIRRLM